MNKKIVLSVFTSVLFLNTCFADERSAPIANKNRSRLSLAGQWTFKLDPHTIGLKVTWYSRSLKQAVLLPGTLDEQKLSYKTSKKDIYRLTPDYQYVGPAWYQKEITIPLEWQDKTVFLCRMCTT